MKNLLTLILLSLVFTACASSSKPNYEMLEKYPACYHHNVKLSNKCIEKNEAGEKTTALELENKALPGQYQ